MQYSYRNGEKCIFDKELFVSHVSAFFLAANIIFSMLIFSDKTSKNEIGALSRVTLYAEALNVRKAIY